MYYWPYLPLALLILGGGAWYFLWFRRKGKWWNQPCTWIKENLQVKAGLFSGFFILQDEQTQNRFISSWQCCTKPAHRNRYVQNLWWVIYMLNDSVELTTRQTGSLLFSHEKAYSEFKKAKMWSHVCHHSFTGAAMVSNTPGNFGLGEQADWDLPQECALVR